VQEVGQSSAAEALAASAAVGDGKEELAAARLEAGAARVERDEARVNLASALDMVEECQSEVETVKEAWQRAVEEGKNHVRIEEQSGGAPASPPPGPSSSRSLGGGANGDGANGDGAEEGGAFSRRGGEYRALAAQLKADLQSVTLSQRRHVESEAALEEERTKLRQALASVKAQGEADAAQLASLRSERNQLEKSVHLKQQQVISMQGQMDLTLDLAAKAAASASALPSARSPASVRSGPPAASDLLASERRTVVSRLKLARCRKLRTLNAWQACRAQRLDDESVACHALFAMSVSTAVGKHVRVAFCRLVAASAAQQGSECRGAGVAVQDNDEEEQTNGRVWVAVGAQACKARKRRCFRWWKTTAVQRSTGMAVSVRLLTSSGGPDGSGSGCLITSQFVAWRITERKARARLRAWRCYAGGVAERREAALIRCRCRRDRKFWPALYGCQTDIGSGKRG
jgi:hypothetical protein